MTEGLGRAVQEVDLWAHYDRIRVPAPVARGARSDLPGAGDAALMRRRRPKARLVPAAIHDFLGAG